MAVRHFLTLPDLSKNELLALLKRASELKVMQHKRIPHEYLPNRVLAMVFEKSSTRTRVSFEAAMTQLGGSVPTVVPEIRSAIREVLKEHAYSLRTRQSSGGGSWLRTHRCVRRRTRPGRRVRAGGLCEVVAAISIAPAGGPHVAWLGLQSASFQIRQNSVILRKAPRQSMAERDQRRGAGPADAGAVLDPR